MNDATDGTRARRRVRRSFLYGLASLLALTAGAILNGCGGGGGSGITPAPAPTPVADMGHLVFGPDAVQVSLQTGQASPVHLGRGYVRLSAAGKPLEVGFQLYDDALAGIPPTPYNVPAVFNAVLPPEAMATTLFRDIGLSKWTGHDPPGVGEVPHFHAVFLFQGVQRPSPNLQTELTRVNPREVAPGFIDGRNVPTAVVPGVGNGFENPTFPHMNPGWYGLTYNFFYYGGHLNGIGFGVTNNFLATTQSQSMVIAQPAVYPKPGLYPHHMTIRPDATLKSHLFILDDLRPGTPTL